MHHVKMKIAGIAHELITFFYAAGGTDFDIKIREDAEQHAIFFRSNYDDKHFPKVEQLIRYLNQGRNPALEESYWGLAGGGDLQDESEMLLIGAMIDHADIKVKDGYVTFYLYRNRG